MQYPGFRPLRVDGNVDADTWRAMGLKLNATIEEEFEWWNRSRGGDTVRMTITGNHMHIAYTPKFYFGKFADCMTEKEKEAVVKEFEKGFKEWAGSYTIYGLNVTVEVNVISKIVTEKSDSNIRFEETQLLRSMVPGAMTWSPTNALVMYIREGTPQNISHKLPMHEFGHVLGLGDAYGNWGINAKAAPDITVSNDVMYSDWGLADWIVTDLNIEMILWAWNRNVLQAYGDGLATLANGEISQAFFH